MEPEDSFRIRKSPPLFSIQSEMIFYCIFLALWLIYILFFVYSHFKHVYV
jgi:hypothetical protein